MTFDLPGPIREMAGHLPYFGVLRRAFREPTGLARASIVAARRALASAGGS